MPRTNQPLSDVTRNSCPCCAHDVLFQKGQGCERDFRIEDEAPLSLAPFVTGPASVCAHWRQTVLLHAMIASGATCEARHRAGSGVQIIHTAPNWIRFGYWSAGEGYE